jgi:hypothetical protein
MLPQNCRSGLCFPCVSPYTSPACHLTCLIHTSHSLQYPNHQDITSSSLWYFLSWFVHKSYVVSTVPVFRAILPALSRNSGVQVHSQIWKVVILNQTLGLPQSDSRMHLHREGPGPPSWMECEILDEPPDFWNWQHSGAKNRHIRDRKSWQGNFLLIKRVQACALSSWANTEAQNGWQWLLLISLRQLYLPLTWDLSIQVKGSQSSQLAKRLGGWVRAYSLICVQESRRRSKDLLNMQVT